MVQKTVEYTNFFGEKRKKTLYFNLTKSELTMLSLSKAGGLDNFLQNIIEAEDMPKIIESFEAILLTSYGEKSDDGERFIKGDDISKAFKESPAYDIIFMELVSDEDKAAKFINSVLPEDIDSYVEMIMNKKNQDNGIADDPIVPGA